MLEFLDRTKEIKHSGRILYEHLVGTYNLLRAWGAPTPVCLAGLFHSIYGTEAFRHQTVSLNDRPAIQKLIGPEAEELVYQFCTGNRKTFNNPWLLMIEAANEIEQRKPGWMVSRQEFDRCWPWLEKSMLTTGRTHTKEQVWIELVSGRAFFWCGPKSAIIANPINHPSGLRSLNIWLQGGDLEELQSFHPRIEAWARERGFHRLMGCGRRGWVRAWKGWEECGTRRMKVLNA